MAELTSLLINWHSVVNFEEIGCHSFINFLVLS